ncbi:MAG: response regulator [Nitrospirae bacterium]|nr:response regulator [Nitrospirota bacterium]
MKKVIVFSEFREILQQGESILLRENIAVYTAESPEEIALTHRKERVDLIIAPLQMRGIAGDDLCLLIRQDKALKAVSIILITPKDKTAMEKCIRAGANACIPLPVKPERLFGKMTELLHISERQRLRSMIKVSVSGKSSDREFFAFAENISVSGMLIGTDMILSKGDRISCTFYVDRRITVAGEIVRVEKKGPDFIYYGIHFTELNPEITDEIACFVRSNRRV